MKTKLNLLLLAPVLALTVSCGGPKTITINKTEFQILSLSNLLPRYGQVGINFDFSEALYFKESESSTYKVNNTISIKETTFDASLITSSELYFREWYEGSTSEETYVVGYSCGMQVVASTGLPDDATIKVEYVSKLYNSNDLVAECSGDITFTVVNIF